jgi:hypothetical protein
VFFSERYSRQDLEPQGYEVSISEDGALATITGFPPADLCGQAGLPGDRTPGC